MKATCVFAVLLQSALCQTPNNTPAPAALSSDLAETIRQTVTRVVAYGEIARICTAQLANDQSQIRDLVSRTRDNTDRISGLTQDAQKIRATAGARPTVDANTEYNKVSAQIVATQNLQKTFDAQAAGFSADLGKQQKCIDDAKAQLAALIANPAQRSTAGKAGQK